MDIKTVQVRVEHEGLSFLTITLPDFGKDFHKSLEQGSVDSSLFKAFSRKREAPGDIGLPRFLGGFLSRVFDGRSGLLLADPDVTAIFAIRQLSLLFSKILLPCSDARVRRAMSEFVECEQDVRKNDAGLTDADLATFARVSSLLFADVWSRVDLAIYSGNIVPRHGPGSTSDKLRGNAKYNLSTWTDRLEEIFLAGEFLLPSWSYYDHYRDIDILEPGQELPVKVIPVPKTLKTPRIIAMEPTCMQYVQQGILERLLESIGESPLLGSMIGFRDQEINQLLAREGSLTGELATLDLSEASDRVSNQLVRTMLRNHPWSFQGVDACRSRKADVPGHGVIRLAKFAPMGSALCFPIEAMVFLTCVFVGVEQELNRPLTRRDVKSLASRVRVYGDDIIVPSRYVRSAVGALERFGARVNLGKSYVNGKFRESCGKEYFNGLDVSIVKVRQPLPTQQKCVTEINSTVSLRNQFYNSGLVRTAEWLDAVIGKYLKYFPNVLPESPVLGREEFGFVTAERSHPHLQSPLVRGYVMSHVIPSDPLDGHGALLKYFLKRGEQPFADGSHLERAGRPQAVNIRLRWASPL